MTQYQHYGILADGTMAHAGVSTHKAANATAARKVRREWVKWATKYVAENLGDYPTAATVRALPVNPYVEVRMHPVGSPEQCQAFRL